MEFINSKYIKNVSLITVVYNEGENINDFLKSYLEQEYYAEEFVVIDGGSKDGTFEIIKEFSVSNPALNLKVISDVKYSKLFSQSPIADARNAAIELAKHDYIAVTDAGCLLDKRWLCEIIKPFDNNSVDIVSGWYEALCDNQFQKKFAEIFLPKKEATNSDDFLPSSRSLAFKKSCWEALNGYPNKSHYGEDTMFDVLLKQKGFKFYFASEAVVYWRVPNNVKEACQKYFNYGTGDGYYRLHRIYYLKLFVHAVFPIKYLISEDFIMKYRIYFALLRGYLNGTWRRITR
ncbi:MAG: glycosyltransferase [Candidatus Kapaibacterium sp.]